MKKLSILFLFFSLSFLHSQQLFPQNHQFVPFDGKEELHYKINLKKNKTYIISVFQKSIDVEVLLFDDHNQQIISTDLADGNNGYDKLEYAADKNGTYTLIIKSVSGKPIPDGIIKIDITTVNKVDLSRRKRIAEELKEENSKDITTIDIQHFWEAYDQLKKAKTNQDSVNIIQKNYLDKATDGLKEFQKVRYFSAEFFVERIRKYHKYYESVRNNTLLPLQMNNLGKLTTQFKHIYPKAKPARTCFAIGPMSTGGTISNNYLLIGIEMIAGDETCDVSEITNENLKSDILSRKNSQKVTYFVQETVAHEYVHTQQKPRDKESCDCTLLDQIIREGVASFVSEKLLMNRPSGVNSLAERYATDHEKELWQEIKNQLCTKDLSNWLFNAATSKNRPGDLGYRMGYKIAESYYEDASDKQQAIQEMIEMDNPLLFLDKSKYDLKFK